MKLLNLFKASEEKQLARTQFEAARAEFTKEELRAAGIGPVQSLLSYFRSSLSSSVDANGPVDVTQKGTEAQTDIFKIIKNVALTPAAGATGESTDPFFNTPTESADSSTPKQKAILESIPDGDTDAKPGFFSRVGKGIKSFLKRTWKPVAVLATAAALLLVGRETKVDETVKAQAAATLAEILPSADTDGDADTARPGQEKPNTPADVADKSRDDVSKTKVDARPSHDAKYAQGWTDATGLQIADSENQLGDIAEAEKTLLFTVDEQSDNLIELREKLLELDKDGHCAKKPAAQTPKNKVPAKKWQVTRHAVRVTPIANPEIITVTFAPNLTGLERSIKELETAILPPPASTEDVANVCRKEIAGVLHGKQLLPTTNASVRQILDPSASSSTNTVRVATTENTDANGPNPDALHITFKNIGGECKQDVTSTNSFPHDFRNRNSLTPADNSVTIITDSLQAVRLNGPTAAATNNLAPEAK